MSSDWLVMRCINNMAWRRGSRWLHLTTWLQWLIARNGKRYQADGLTFHSDVLYPITGPCHVFHPRPCATTAPLTLVLLTFLAVQERKGQYFLLATSLDSYHDRTVKTRRWRGPVDFKTLICFDTLWYFALLPQARADERGRKPYPKANGSIHRCLRSWLYILECLMFRKFILVKAQENVCFYFTQSKNIGQCEIKKWK